MGCSQSKTNEHEMFNMAKIETLEPAMSEMVAKTDNKQLSHQISIDGINAESQFAPIMGTPIFKAKTSGFALRFLPGEVCINEYGVAFYNFDGSNPADPTQENHVCKRYSEFKKMHAVISKLMSSENNLRIKDEDKFQTYPSLPPMPRANAVTCLLGRGNEKVVKEREEQFVKILNAIAAHPIAFQNKTFTNFIS